MTAWQWYHLLGGAITSCEGANEVANGDDTAAGVWRWPRCAAGHPLIKIARAHTHTDAHITPSPGPIRERTY